MGPHGKRMCYGFKLLKGGVSIFLPPSQGDQSGPVQRNPIILKAVKEHYHNLDPIACYIGK